MDSFVFHAVIVVGRASLPIPAHFVRIDSFIRPELSWLIALRLTACLIFHPNGTRRSSCKFFLAILAIWNCQEISHLMMPSSDDSSEISPSLAEFTAQSVPAAMTVTTTQSTSTAPAAIAASDRTDRPVFPVTILGPTNSSNQAPPNRHDDDDVHTTRQQNNVTLRSSDTNTNRQQTRPNSDAERDDDDGDTNPRRRIDSPPPTIPPSSGPRQLWKHSASRTSSRRRRHRRLSAHSKSTEW